MKPLALVIVFQRKAFEWEKVTMMQASQELNLSMEIIIISSIKIFNFFHQTNTTITLSKIRSVRRNFRIAKNDSLKTIGCFSNLLVWNSSHKKYRT